MLSQLLTACFGVAVTLGYGDLQQTYYSIIPQERDFEDFFEYIEETQDAVALAPDNPTTTAAVAVAATRSSPPPTPPPPPRTTPQPPQVTSPASAHNASNTNVRQITSTAKSVLVNTSVPAPEPTTLRSADTKVSSTDARALIDLDKLNNYFRDDVKYIFLPVKIETTTVEQKQELFNQHILTQLYDAEAHAPSLPVRVKHLPMVLDFDSWSGPVLSNKTFYDESKVKIKQKELYDVYKPGDIAITVCASRVGEALNSVKSLLMFSKSSLHIVVFAEDAAQARLKQTLHRWAAVTQHRFYFEIYAMEYPETDKEYWKSSYTNCTALKLFLPNYLAHIDALLYVDTDTIFLGPVEELWLEFSRFTGAQVAALAAEHNEASRAWAWYPRYATHPFYGDFGLNAGVILMNLTRMRDFGWAKRVRLALRKWKHHIIYSDQDVINIIFDYNPARVLELPCRANYRADVPCAGAARDGVLLLHGNRQAFHRGPRNDVFRAVYDAMDSYEVGEEPLKTFLPNLKALVGKAWYNSTKFKHLKSSFLKIPIKTLYKIK